ncbi:MAG TPA: class I SAM-dependent methyltransferase, partial [Isosphaeraceae bacterium]
GDLPAEQLERQARTRYELEPYLRDFADFPSGAGRDVLEIGVGMGADHLEWARARPRSLSGIDLTDRAIGFTGRRLAAHGFASDLRVGDAEDLPFADASFDLVYSWGVIHHSPDTPRAVGEIRRVLRPGGRARVMIYHSASLVGAMLWLRYGLLAGRPGRGLEDIYAHHLESPGTKAYPVAEARRLFAGFARAEVRPQLTFGDLLQGGVGQRHRGPLLAVAKALYPRWLVRRAFSHYGLYLLIRATK